MVFIFVFLLPVIVFGCIAGAMDFPEPFASMFGLMGPVIVILLCINSNANKSGQQWQRQANLSGPQKTTLIAQYKAVLESCGYQKENAVVVTMKKKKFYAFVNEQVLHLFEYEPQEWNSCHNKHEWEHHVIPLNKIIYYKILTMPHNSSTQQTITLMSTTKSDYYFDLLDYSKFKQIIPHKAFQMEKNYESLKEREYHQ